MLRPMTEPERSAPLPLLRLVDGPSVLSGRLQVLHSGLWRDVCSNTRKSVLYLFLQNLNLFIEPVLDDEDNYWQNSQKQSLYVGPDL